MGLVLVCPPMPLSARCDSFTPTPPARTLLTMNSGADAGDDVLMLAWTGGDATAFELLYGRHRGPLYRFLLRQTRDQAPQPFPATRAGATPVTATPAPAPPPSAATASAASAARRALAPPPDASSAEASASPSLAGQDSASLDRSEVSGTRIAVAELPVRDDVRLGPVAWLQRIRDRRDAGDLDGARESLALLSERHPRIRLPDDLARLGR